MVDYIIKPGDLNPGTSSKIRISQNVIAADQQAKQKIIKLMNDLLHCFYAGNMCAKPAKKVFHQKAEQ